MTGNMDTGRDVPGIRLNQKELQTICCRYYTAGRFAAGKKVLEVGCGAGLGLGYLSKKAQSVIGGDISEDALKEARGHYQKRIELVRLDAHKLPFRDACFDTVVAMEILYYLPHPDEFLDECRRVLADGGTLVLCIGNKDYPAPPSRSYNLSTPELSTLLKRHFNAEIFGAFPGEENPAGMKLRVGIYKIAGKALSFIPGGKGLVSRLGNLANNRNLRLPAELEEKDMTAENFKLTPIATDYPDTRHRFLYAIAHTRKISLNNG
jgi:SAM-dependent methyltransferase